MKKLVYTAFIVFCSAIGTLLALYWLGPGFDGEPAGPVSGADGPAAFSMAEIAAHDTLEDCWMVIEGEVYDISDYVPRHPAPPGVLEPWCGREATEGMRTKGEDSDHSQRAWRMLGRYRIGVLIDGTQS